MPHKDTRLDANSDFIPATQPQVINTIRQTHEISRGTLKGTQLAIICKKINDPALAQLEQLAQEFFRLIIPHQPETYLAVNKTTGVHYIFSQEVPGYTKLPTGQGKKFKEDGGFTGLGQVCLTSMFLQECDLKNGNLGLNNKNQVIKIDGDWCFSAGRRAGIYKITTEGINNLPYPKDFSAYNWLDLIREGVAQPASSIISNDLSQSSKFRAEVNQAILKICLLPDAFIEQFVDAYISDGGQRFVTFIKERREDLRSSALKNTSFVNYLATPAATMEVIDLVTHMKSFKANKTELVTNLTDLEDKVKAQMHGLQSTIQQAKPLINEIRVLLTQFRAIEVVGKNKELDNYLDISEQMLISLGYDPVQLPILKAELSKKLPLAKKDNVFQQSKALMDGIDVLFKKIRIVVPINQDRHLDDFLEVQREQVKSALFDIEKLTFIKNEMNSSLITELIKAIKVLANKIEIVTNKKEATEASLSDINKFKNNPFELEKLLNFHIDLYSIYKAEVLVKENEQLVDKLKEYIASDWDTELAEFLESAVRDTNQYEQEPPKLELINKALLDKFRAIPDMLKKDCQSLLKDIANEDNNEQYKEKLKTNDPQVLMGIKLDLTVELSIQLNEAIMFQLDEIQKIFPAPKDISHFISDSECQLDRIGSNPQALKALLAEVGDKYHKIKASSFQAMKDSIQGLRGSQTNEAATAPNSTSTMKERLAQIKADNLPDVGPTRAISLLK